jgi:predicted amidohydrolase
MRVACVQMRSGRHEPDNIAAMAELVREAASQGASYVQTPEMTGLVERERKKLIAEISPDEGNPVFARASELARALGIWLHIGSAAVKVDGTADNGKAYNRASIFAPSGERIAVYDKIHMFDVDLDHGESWRESAVYQPGSSAVVTCVDDTMLGMAICYDLRFPDLFRREAVAGAAVLSAPAAFTRQTGEAHWHTLIRARAIENGAFMICAAQGGTHEDGRETYGHSLVVDPWGRIVGEIDHDEPGVLVCDIDIAESAKARGRIPNLKNAREFDLRIEDREVAMPGRGAA